MKRLFTLLTALLLAAALCAPVLADDSSDSVIDNGGDTTAVATPTPTPTIDTTTSDGVYVSAYTVTDTVGGDVEAGLAIAELISGMKKPTVSLVLGGGHSIGVPLAVCAKKSFIVPSATMTIHPVRMNGLVIGVPQTFTYFMRMQERIIDFIVKNSHVSEQVLRSLMLETDELAADIGTVIDGLRAVDIGLIDAVGSLSEAMDALKEMCRQAKK